MQYDAVKYEPSLDGVRGAAVLAVLVAHSTIFAEGGAMGVDVFFVLSGYLITTLLRWELAQRGRLNYPAFYMRRAWRLYPPMIVTLVLVALLPNVYHLPTDGPSAARWITIPIAFFYLTNYADVIGVATGYLAHTWSLAVEEQFYLVWPVALAFLSRRRHALTPVLLAAIVAVICLRPFMGISWLPSRADELLLGALVAIQIERTNLPTWTGRAWVGFSGGGVVVAAAALVSATHARSTPFVVATTLAGLGAAALILNLAVSPAGVVAGALRNRALVGLGKVSYSVYLLHFPIFQWVQHQRWHWALTYAVELALTAVAVTACWYLVETPARRQKAKWSASARERTTADVVGHTI